MLNVKSRPTKPFGAQEMHRFRAKTPIFRRKKKPRIHKIDCPQFRGRKWLRQFYGQLEFCVVSAGEDLHANKIIRFRGGVFGFFFWGGGG